MKGGEIKRGDGREGRNECREKKDRPASHCVVDGVNDGNKETHTQLDGEEKGGRGGAGKVRGRVGVSGGEKRKM